jgi:dihydroneopterin aldolase
MDTIQVSDIRAYGYTGALPEENTLGQWFRVDLTLWLDLSKAGATDDLTTTYDYRAAIAATQQIIREKPFRLIEVLASEIAKAVLNQYESLHQVQVRLTKVAPPIADFSGQIVVEICRDRSHLNHPSPTPMSLT